MIFTFYSYKGGVGRSMAVAGVAHLLAQRGLKVLAIDFDLEAPGLERYFFDGERCRSIREQPGLIDLIQTYRRALTSEAAFEEAEFKRWDRFKLTAIHEAGIGPERGRVDLMTSGQRAPGDKLRDYALAVRGFDWQDFFHNWKGDLFFDWFRRQITQAETGYDVVIVDSRTGVTEMGGVCAYQLADAAVLLCAPNYQNLEGTVDVVRDFRSEGVLALRQGRPLEILAVPARLAEAHPRRGEFLDTFARELGVDAMPKVLADAGLNYARLALPYLPAFAVEEQLVGEVQQRVAEEGSAARSPVEVFETLADALTLLAEPASRLGSQRSVALARLHGGVERPTELLADTTRISAGFDVFIEAAREDAEGALELQRRLDRAGLSVFYDRESIRSGEALPVAIANVLDYSRHLLVCFGAGRGGETRAQILAQARRRQRVRIVPVLLPGSDMPVLASFDLEEQQSLDLRDWPAEDVLQRWISSVRSAGPATPQAPAKPARDPYPGARAYAEDDAEVFAGREAEVDRLAAALAGHEVVLLSGAAQVGKTSLLRAGLLPRLRRDGVLPADALVWIDHGGEGVPDWPSWLLDAGEPAAARLVVIDGIDSFADDAGKVVVRQRRWAHIRAALRHADAACRFLLCWRDVLPDDERAALLEAVPKQRLGSIPLSGGEGFATNAPIRFTRIDLEPLQGEALQRAIEEPARRAGHLLESGLAARLIESAGPARNAIAQIQLALAAAWPERRRGWLSHKNLDAAGHLAGVFDRHFNAAVASLSTEQAAAAQVLFKRLVAMRGNLVLAPVPQPWPVLASVPVLAKVDAVALRDRLAAAGLIDLWREPSAGAEEAAGDVQLSLARPKAMAYFGGDGAEVPDPRFLFWRGGFESYVLAWRRLRPSSDALISGAVLAEAEGWLGSHGEQLDGDERDLIESSLRARDVAREGESAFARASLLWEQNAARMKRRTLLMFGAMLAALLMFAAAVYFYIAADRARTEAKALRVGADGGAMPAGAGATIRHAVVTKPS